MRLPRPSYGKGRGADNIMYRRDGNRHFHRTIIDPIFYIVFFTHCKSANTLAPSNRREACGRGAMELLAVLRIILYSDRLA